MSAGDDADAGDTLGPPADLPEWFVPDEGERVEWVGEPAAVSLVPAAVWGVVLLPLLGLGLVVFASAYLNRAHTDYVVTDETLYHKRGVLSTNIESLGVDRIQNTEYTRSFVGARFGYGTIEVSTAGSAGSNVTFRAVEQPRAVRDLVARVSKRAGGGDGTGGARARDDASEAAGGGDADDLVGEVTAELRAINESMANVERLLRERQGFPERADPTTPGRAEAGGSGGSGRPVDPGGGDRSGSGGSASDFVRNGPDEGTDDEGPPAPPFGGGY